MKRNALKKIRELAEERDSIKLYKVATGETPILSYLSDYIKENDLAETPVSGTTLIQIVNANARRRKQLAKWIEKEENTAYLNLYQKEIKLLDDYAELVFFDLIDLDEETEEAE